MLGEVGRESGEEGRHLNWRLVELGFEMGEYHLAIELTMRALEEAEKSS